MDRVELSGRNGMVFSAGRDVTSQVEGQMELAGSLETTRAILDAVVDSIITIDEQFRVLDVSPVPTESTAFRTTSDEVRTRSTLSCPMTAITSQRSCDVSSAVKMGRSRVIASERTTSTAQR